MAIGRKTFLRAAVLVTASIGLSGCVYDVGLGYASDGFYNDGYACDPYGGYDAYHDCDYGHGYANIGFGGGWYDSYFYPGYGFFLFDNVGRRYPMRDHHRRYWGEQQQSHYREHRRRDGDGRRYGGRPRDYTNDATMGVIGSPERTGGRLRDGSRRDVRRDGGRDRVDQRRGGEGRGADAAPTPNPQVAQGQVGGRNRHDGDGRGGNGANAVPVPPQRAHYPASQAREPRTERVQSQPVRQHAPEGGIERPE